MACKEKAEPWKDWAAVEKALKESQGLVSRPWLCGFSLPTCGPALSIPFLSWNARKIWSKLGPVVLPDEAEHTVYWHILDHGKKNGS